jgi:hypothetical protein
MKDRYIDECKIIKQNSEYTAETHHLMADHHRKIALWFQLGPAVLAAISSSATTLGASFSWLPIVTMLSAVVAAVATVLNPNKRYEEHLSAAKAFTALKHDARFLSSAEAMSLSDDAFTVRVKNLHDQYNALVRTVPPTEVKFFEKARERILAGRHDPDGVNGH